MISFKKHQSKDSGEQVESFERMAQMLLQAIGLHAVEGERADYDAFRAVIADLQTKLAEDSSPANVPVVTSRVLKELQEYNQRASAYIRAKNSELQGMVGMLTQAMSDISAGSVIAVSQLQKVQKSIEQTCMVDDMRTLRTQLSECLESIRTESKRQQEDSTRAVTQLNQLLRTGRPAKAPPAAGDVDPLTGLALRAQGEMAIQDACAGEVQTYVGLFLIDRIQVISSRFGVALGDKLALFFLQHLSQGLSPRDQLYRWSRGAFLAVMERQESHEHVRRELARLLSRRLEQTFEMGDRSVVIPVASTWIVIPLYKSDPTEVGRKLDAFIAASPG